ncbi:3-hydroxyacyl-CoA dehydrogenase family protein [Streptomyces sp. YC504]|uniref:3-hydroxyacyl-CoA dehydrogenase family protein n=1 Tax=Streptomyces mesophilus TaxID=1775132 RepID=A0A6G4XEL7_9ACTN|nr:3-hydroxyacyl-CoA dehydrogenase family protein [Streptomyces mesophilus]NGO75979.1 3-hydroxyacyl-CoA dehydrogenase family protein [Streptomyces mesophilus]
MTSPTATQTGHAPDPTGRPVAVVGAGTLGRRIALMFAARGGTVRLYDPSAAARREAAAFVAARLPEVVDRLDDGSPGPVQFTDTAAQAVTDAWLVVEAVPEDLGLKREVLADLDRLAAPDAVLASNSSSYPTSRLIDGVTRPTQVLNLHFYLPPEMNAVEVMSSGQTDRSVIDLVLAELPKYGLRPFEARAESTGFIFNRIWAAIKRECLCVVADGVATPQEIDDIWRLNSGSAAAPFRLMDVVGLDVVLDIEKAYAAERADLPETPRTLLTSYLEAGRLGVKSGRGFYDDYRPAGS